MDHNEAEVPVAEMSSTQAQVQSEREFPLASRLSRLLAQLLDGFILLVAAVPLMLLLGWPSEADLNAIIETEIMPFELALKITLLGLFLYVLVHGYTLWYFGQTIGKRMMRIAIVDSAGRVPSFYKLVGLRYSLFQIISVIPLISALSLADVLLIFRSDRRCLHDMLAGTRVVDVSGIMGQESPEASD